MVGIGGGLLGIGIGIGVGFGVGLTNLGQGIAGGAGKAGRELSGGLRGALSETISPRRSRVYRLKQASRNKLPKRPSAPCILTDEDLSSELPAGG